MLSSFVAVDTETTGLDFEHDRVIELAAVRFENGKPVADFTALLSPGDRSLSPVSRLITGLTDAELQAAPPAAETWRAFLEFVGDSSLVAHNAEFDAHFVRKSLEAEALPALSGVWIDSLLLSRIAWPMWDSHRLDSLAERLNVPRDAEHRALPDARRAGYVFDAAQRFVHEKLSARGWDALARLATELPDWSLVFHGVGGTETATSVDAGDRAAAAPASVPETGSASANTIHGAMDDAMHSALASESWLALETPPGWDEHLAGLRAACVAAKSGQRVLLAVPDLFAWNTLRRLGESQDVTVRAFDDNPARLPPEERAALLPLVAWADRNPEGPVADGRGFSPDRARLAWSRVHCDAWDDDASARNARNAAATAGVLLVTHRTLCDHVATAGALLPACDSLIVSGAHRFPETAQSPSGFPSDVESSASPAAPQCIHLARLREILRVLRHASEADSIGDSGLWADLAPGLDAETQMLWRDRWFEPERRLLKFFQTAGRSATKQRPQGDFRVGYNEAVLAAFGADATPVAEALRDNIDFLTRIASTLPATAQRDARRLARNLERFHADLEALCEAGDADAVYWMEDGANPPKASLRSVPLSMEPFGGTLRGLFGAGVFLSPALIAGPHAERDARPFLRAAGLDEAEPPVSVLRVPQAEASYLPRFFMASGAPFLGTGEQAEEFARYLAEAALPFVATGVRVFCPSQGALRALSGALRKVIPEGVPIWAQHLDGNRDAVLRMYATGRGGFVLTAEAMPGLRDADGREPALWVVTRMPLLPPRDPVLEARGAVRREEGGNPKSDLWHPAAILRLKRDWSVLRGAESAEGTKAVWLLDGRAATEGLGARFAGALGFAPDAARDLADLQTKTATALPGSAFSTATQGLS
jgi:DNA polymerase III epsilon subunit family exonuclease